MRYTRGRLLRECPFDLARVRLIYKTKYHVSWFVNRPHNDQLLEEWVGVPWEPSGLISRGLIQGTQLPYIIPLGNRYLATRGDRSVTLDQILSRESMLPQVLTLRLSKCMYRKCSVGVRTHLSKVGVVNKMCIPAHILNNVLQYPVRSHLWDVNKMCVPIPAHILNYLLQHLDHV